MTDGLDSAKTPTRPPLPQADPPTSPPSTPNEPTLVPRADEGTSSFERTVITATAPTRVTGPRIPERLGPYLLLGELGRGGMGIVFRARHTTLGTECAVKVLVAGEHASEESIARFHREAAGVARLGKHPNIVHVFDLGWEGSLAYYAMELIGGRSLRQALRERLFDAREAAGLMERVARALHFAHSHGLVHRDVKPNNILLREDGEPQIVDFGLAREVGSVEQWSVTGDIMGTPEYMSPEQAGGLVDQTDARTDVYAVGAVLYECLAGIPPHRGETWPELLQQILDGDVVPLSKLRHGIPRDLETICLKCLEVRRESRYATAEELADDLARFRNGEPVHARPVSSLERLRRRTVRHWRIVLPTTIAALLALGIGAWLLSVYTHDAGALAGALEMGRKYRTQDRPREARDMYVEARRIDRANLEAIAGVRWADAELSRMEHEADEARRRAEEAEALLRKSRLVIRVLGRWGRLHRSLREMERWGYSTLPPEALHAKTLRAWEQVEAFMKETPDDPTSRAAMLALAGWARRTAGHPDDGIAMMREAARIDPDVPYGALMEALVRFSRFVEAYSLPDVSMGEEGVEIGEAPEAPPEVAAERDRIPPLLDQARKARIFGEEGAEGFGVAIQAIEAMQKGDYPGAERFLDDALGRPELLAFQTGLLLARARVRYLQKRVDAALEDVREVVAARPEQPEARLILGQVLHAQALADLVARRNPHPGILEAIEAFTRAEGLRPGGCAALNNRGGVRLLQGDLERDAGTSPEARYAEALADFDEALRRSPDLELALNNRGNAHARIGEWLERQGKDPRPEYLLALADYDRSSRSGLRRSYSTFNRAQVLICLGHAERVHGNDPEPTFRRALDEYDAYLALRPDDPSGVAARASVHFERGLAKAARGVDPREDLRLAIEEMERAIQARPSFVKVRYNRGKAWLSLGKWEADHDGDFRAAFASGLTEFDGMVRIAPDNPQAYEGRATARLNLADVLLARGEDAATELLKGIADLEESLARGAVLLDTRVRLGQAQARFAEVQQAAGRDPVAALRASIASMDGAIALAPDVVSHRVLRGQVRSTLLAILEGQGEDVRGLAHAAITDLTLAVQADSEETASLFRRAMVRLTLARQELEADADPARAFREALEDFQEVIRRDADDVEARVRYADALRRYAAFRMSLGESGSEPLSRSIEQLDEAVRRAPGHVPLLVTRSGILQTVARLRMDEGKDTGDLLDRSLADAQEALRREPDNAWAQVMLGDAWLGRAKAASLAGATDREACEKAIAGYDRALALDASFAEAHLFRGAAWELLGNDEEAASAYERFLALRPSQRLAERLLRHARERIAVAGEPAWARDCVRGTHAVDEGRHAEAREILERALADAEAPTTDARRRVVGAARYSLACVYSLLSTTNEPGTLRDQAFACLEEAARLGIDDIEAIEGDDELAPLRADPRWKGFAERIRGGGK